MRLFLPVFAVATLAACGAPKVVHSPAATSSRMSTSADRKDVAITVYNGDFGLVRETRLIDLGEGRISLEYRDVSSKIEPQTVHIEVAKLDKGTHANSDVRVLEQNYRYDLLSPEKLLEKYEGKKVKVYRYNKETGKDEEVEAEVLATTNGALLKIGSDITYGFPGRLAFPEVPKNLISKPSLVWLLDSQVAKPTIEVTYLTRGLGWHADYVLTIGDEAVTTATSKAELSGWVTLENRTGASFENAQLKLVAGDVQRLRTGDSFERFNEDQREGEVRDEPAFREQSFFEYHLYALERATSLLSNEQKQVTLLQSSGLEVARQLRLTGQPAWYLRRYTEPQTNQKVGVFLEIENTEKNHLGMPLPKGVVRVYKADKSGATQFIGEDNIDHTPRDEKVRIKVGESFDVVGDRVQKSYRVISSCVAESDWELVFRNHKDTADSVIDFEPVDGDWEIVKSSLPSIRENAHAFKFDVQIPGRGTTKVTYTVRVRRC